MVKQFILFCILFMHATAVYGASIKIGMKDDIDKTLKLGEVFEGVITVHPTEPSFYNSLLRLEGQFILESLFISEIIDIKLSENNPDVIEARWLGVMVKPFDPQKDKHKLKLGETEFPIAQINLNIEGQPEQIKGFVLIDQEKVKKDFEFKPWMIINIIIFLIGLFYTYKMWKKHKIKKEIKKKKKDEIENWVRIFSRASELEDYEKIYYQRNQWRSVLNYDEVKYQSFRAQINSVQFKKEKDKNEHDFQLVSDSYNEFKKDIEIKNGI